MPDDERTRRRLGDETKGRIADLASGWSAEPPATPADAPVPTPSGRKKPKTLPPPPPGSTARKALEEAIVDSKTPEPRPKQASVPPPIPRGRPTQPPPIPGKLPLPANAAPTPPPLPRPPSPRIERMPPVIVDDSLTIPEPPKLAVPIGEFDSGIKTIDEDRRREAFAQSTIIRDAADALLQLPSPAPPPERGDPTTIDPSTSPFPRGDATAIEGPSIRAHTPAGTLRTTAALRRKRGLVGDVYYVFTALFGVRSSRREIAELERLQQTLQTSRRRHLVTLGRTAVTAETFDHPALGKARDDLAAVEGERSRHAGAVAASDSELDRVRRDRDSHLLKYRVDTSELDAELAELGKKLEPLEKEAASVKRRSGELRESLARIAKQLAETEALLVSVKGEKRDRAEIQAEIATLRADRQAVQRDEPKLAAELDALNPRIAALEAARSDAHKKKAELERSEQEDQRRTTELYEAIGAKRKVVERAAAEAETARDRVLFELGERLYVDRPAILAAQMSPVDRIDLELGENDRRMMEVKEILSSIDRAKIVRGAAVIVFALAVATIVIGWFVYMLV